MNVWNINLTLLNILNQFDKHKRNISIFYTYNILETSHNGT